MLCCLQFSAQSLEAIAFIVAESADRISEFCMHVGMQIYSGSVYCTAPWTHRPIPPRLNCPPLCFEALGARITQIAPPIPHSTTLDKFLCPSPSTIHWLLFFFTSTENLRCPHFVATCGPASKPNCRGCGPKTPRRSCSTRSCRLSHTFGRLSKMLRQIFNNLQASLQDTYNNRQHTIAQAGGETHDYAHTHAVAPGCSHRDKMFPKRVNHRTIQMVQCIVPMRRLIYYINWLASKLSLQAGPRQPAHWYPTRKSPKAVTLVLAGGPLVPMLP